MEIHATIFGETPRAVGIRAGRNFPKSEESIWLPKSQVTLTDYNRNASQGPEGLATARIEMPAWLYKSDVEPFDGNDGWRIL